MKYPEFKGFDLPDIEKKILDFWSSNGVFQKSVELRDTGKAYIFYEGPPSANGRPGIHHVFGRTIKDLFCRFYTMKGYRVERKGGWDTHGLPIEIGVEKELGITKEDIGVKISVEDFNNMCRKTVMRYKDNWEELTRIMGFWVDMENPYITFNNDYIESVWFLLKRLYDKNLLYKGYSVQPYSPAAGTGLSTHELNMPGAYREVKDVSAVVQFKIIRNEQSEFLYGGLEEEGDVYFLAWTTTPWTLPSNTALAVGKQIDYLIVKTFNQYSYQKVHLIIAKDLFSTWFRDEQLKAEFRPIDDKSSVIPCRIIAEFKGGRLEGIRYEQLLPFVQPTDGDAFRVLLGDFVSTDEGTGIVHIAPSFGADDLKIARENGIGSLTLVDRQGKFVKEAGEFAGRYVKNYTDDPKYVNVDIDITVRLKKENKAFSIQKYTHNYPHCWRTDKPVLYYPMDSWFIRSVAAKEQMVTLNKTINWKPYHTGEKRFGNWLENLQDWNLSRSRFWGTPLPIWRSEDSNSEVCIGSKEELEKEIEKANRVLGLDQVCPNDLHRPYIDEIILVSDNGAPMHRERDLIDVWFDSGAMPYAQWHYPFENVETFKENFPADFISEGVDQTRGWFFTLHAIAVMAFDSVAFKNCVSHGLVLDKQGRKMSKRLGNSVEPFDTILDFGADATRWYLISNSQVWDNMKFDLAGVEEVKRKFLGTLYNTYAFFALYGNIDKFRFSEVVLPIEKRLEIDRWIISKLNSLIEEIERDFSSYEPTNATRRISQFVDQHLSNWYVRLSRRRFWKGDHSGDKLAAYQTLYECLITLSKLIAPVSPFFADWLYRNLNNVTALEDFESVHLTFFPTSILSAIDKELEERMDFAQRISSLILSLRKKENIRVRQPLERILVPARDEYFKRQLEAVKDLILSEVNVKDLQYVTGTEGLVKRKAKPNFKTLGKRLGKLMKPAAEQIGDLSSAKISEVEHSGHFSLHIDGKSFEIELDDLIITSEDIPGWLVATDGELTVALDTTLDDSLLAEGTARELVNRIQNLRKNKEFHVTDRIIVQIENHERLVPAIEKFSTYIKTEVLADSIELINSVAGEPVVLFDDLTIMIGLERS